MLMWDWNSHWIRVCLAEAGLKLRIKGECTKGYKVSVLVYGCPTLNLLKYTELYNVNRWIMWYEDYISKLFLKIDYWV